MPRTVLRSYASWLLSLFALLFASGMGRADSPWRYVVPPPGDLLEYPPLRVLACTSQKPEDLQETVRYRGARRRYAQIRYGSPRSIEVALVLDEVGPGEVDLYVDANRDRVIEEKDRVTSTGGVWRLPLEVAILEGIKIKLVPRTVIFRYGRTTRTLSYATCGYLEGKTALAGRTVAVRRMDGDGNGFFADAQDRLWIDVNGDGRFDPLEEQFLFAPVLTLAGTRYAVRSDPLGIKLNFDKLEGTGTVQLRLPQNLAKNVVGLKATLTGKDGAVVGLHGMDANTTVPVGEYRLSVVTLAMKDINGGSNWNFVFSDSGDRPAVWYKVARDATLKLNPIGKLDFLSGVGANATCTPGENFQVRPQLYTGDGLLINTAYRGDSFSTDLLSGGCGAQIRLHAADGTNLTSAFSGFA